MIKIKLILAPLISTFLIMFANGLLVTLIVVKAKILGFNTWIIGSLTSAYYVGMVLGTFRNSEFIIRVGHIRAFSTYACICATIPLLHGLYVNEYVWLLLRIITGYCLTGLYIVIESWLLSASNKKTRGQYLALYMIALYGAQSLGQLLLDYEGRESIEIYCLATIFTSISIIPILATTVLAPQIDKHTSIKMNHLYKISPTGFMGCLVGGLILSGLYGFLPYFVQTVMNAPFDIAEVMFVTIIGGMILQMPIGKISDKLNRRKLLIAILLTTAILACLSLIFYDTKYFYYIIFLLGGMAFTLYPISMSITCDLVSTEEFVSAASGLILAYGMGSIIGPLIVALMLEININYGLFSYFIITSLSFALFVFIRLKKSLNNI